MEPRDIIVRPCISEKGSAHMELRNQYSFEVARSANKIEIRKAIENIFDVKVKHVQTMNVKGKARRMGWVRGRTPAWRKAIVRLAEGSRIDLF